MEVGASRQRGRHGGCRGQVRGHRSLWRQQSAPAEELYRLPVFLKLFKLPLQGRGVALPVWAGTVSAHRRGTSTSGADTLERTKAGRSECGRLSGLTTAARECQLTCHSEEAQWPRSTPWVASWLCPLPPRLPWISHPTSWSVWKGPPPKSTEGILWGCEGEGTGCR